MGRTFNWVFLVSLLLVPVTAWSQATLEEDSDTSIFSNNAWGSRGSFHLHAARPVHPGTLALSIANSLTSDSDVLARGDHDFQSTVGLALLWSPYESIELGLSQTTVVDRYQQTLPSELQLMGNPSLLLKYAAPFDALYPALGAGGYVQVTVPTSPGGQGWSPADLRLSVVGIASLRVHSNVDLSANLGYVFDRSSHLFDGRILTPIEHYVFGIDGSQSRATYGLAAVGGFDVHHLVALSPFAEVWGEYSGSVPLAQNPVAATLGLKVFPAQGRMVEGILGTDVRLGGEPHVGAQPAGLPAWRVFAQVTLRLGEAKPRLDRVWVPRCDTNQPCVEGHECEGFACVKVKEVIVEKVVTQEVRKPPEMVAFTGIVLDEESGQPLAGARVKVSGQTDTLTVDSDNGRFNVCPLPADGGLVKLSASALGYVDTEQTVTRAQGAGESPIVLRMRPTGKPVTGLCRGSVRDAVTGKPVADVVIAVPAASIKVPVQDDGSFETRLNVGRYQMLVSAPNYETQKKDVRIANDQVIVLNIDLQPKHSGKASKTKH